jgi:predicted nucleotidyltransferase
MLQIELPMDEIAALCEKWRITELAVFGSVLRDDFRPDSDVDLLVTFEHDAPWDLFDIVDIKDEFAAILNRHVDIVEPSAVTNPYARKEIQETSQVVYERAA